MSGVDPLASLVVTALDLGVPVPVLQAQINIGDLLAATVLPPQNGMDLIEILGQQVVAQLPPDVHPGDELVLQVTGFTRNQILVQNLGHADLQNPVPTVNVTLRPPDVAPTTPSVDSGIPTAPAVNGNAARVTESAARVVANAPSVILSAPGVIGNTPAAAGKPASATNTPARVNPGPTRVTVSLSNGTPTPDDHLNARIAAAQTAMTQTSSRIPVGAQVRSAVQQIAQRVVHTVGDLLKMLRLPDTSLTRTAATIAPQAPARLPSVLHRLDSALPRESADPRVATLKTLIAFVTRIDPANEETLPTQLSSYVSHVIEGAEPKTQQLLQALAQTREQAPPSQPQPETQPETNRDRMAEPLPPASATHVVSQAVSHAASHARAAERMAAIEHDLKSLVLSLLRNPGVTRTPALSQALNETFITLTAVQLNVLSSNAQSPGTLALTLPVFYHEGGKPAQIRISKDAQSRFEKIDADNFHIGFVLDTAHLGTVAIDLQTVGRTVKIDVKTEAEPSVSRFTQTLDSLRKRLEDLRYRVGSTAVTALNRTDRISAPLEQSASADAGGQRNLDLHA